MSNSDQIKKSLYNQILDKMVDKLNNSEFFSNELLSKIRSMDMLDKNGIKELISEPIKRSSNENS